MSHVIYKRVSDILPDWGQTLLSESTKQLSEIMDPGELDPLGPGPDP